MRVTISKLVNRFKPVSTQDPIDFWKKPTSDKGHLAKEEPTTTSEPLATRSVDGTLTLNPEAFNKEEFLRSASQVERTLAERGSRYGDFLDNANLSQLLEETIRHQSGYNNLNNLHREALKFIFQKISRIVNGDPNYADNWHDIQGYAKLVEERLPK